MSVILFVPWSRLSEYYKNSRDDDQSGTKTTPYDQNVHGFIGYMIRFQRANTKEHCLPTFLMKLLQY